MHFDITQTDVLDLVWFPCYSTAAVHVDNLKPDKD